ncbi:MAG: hypothetical protein AAGH15_12900 [Myxococcota bacterium]
MGGSPEQPKPVGYREPALPVALDVTLNRRAWLREIDPLQLAALPLVVGLAWIVGRPGTPLGLAIGFAGLELAVLLSWNAVRQLFGALRPRPTRIRIDAGGGVQLGERQATRRRPGGWQLELVDQGIRPYRTRRLDLRDEEGTLAASFPRGALDEATLRAMVAALGDPVPPQADLDLTLRERFLDARFGPVDAAEGTARVKVKGHRLPGDWAASRTLALVGTLVLFAPFLFELTRAAETLVPLGITVLGVGYFVRTVASLVRRTAVVKGPPGERRLHVGGNRFAVDAAGLHVARPTADGTVPELILRDRSGEDVLLVREPSHQEIRQLRAALGTPPVRA